MKAKTRILSVLCLLAMLLGTFSVSIDAAFTELRSSLGARSTAKSTSTSTSTTSVDYTQYVDMTFSADGNGSSTTMGPLRPNGSIAPNPVSSVKPYDTGYTPSCEYLRGFSQIDLSCGAPRYSNFLLSPQTGCNVAILGHDSKYTINSAKAEELSVTLTDYNITTNLTSAEHSAIYKINYPAASGDDNVGSVVMEMLNTYNVADQRYTDININELEDGNIAIWGGCCNGGNNNLYIYFYAVVQKPESGFTDWGTYYLDEPTSKSTRAYLEATKNVVPFEELTVGGVGRKDAQKGMGAYAKFERSEEAQDLYVKVAISFYSPDAAKDYLDDEIPAWDYEGVKTETKRIWNEKLSTLTISENSTDAQKRMFYTAFVKAFINPNRRDSSDYVKTYYTGTNRSGSLEAVTGEHKFMNEDGGYTYPYIIDDQLCTWDTFRTTYPLYSLVDPELMADTVNSYILRLDYNGCVRDMILGGVERDRNQGGDDVDNVIAEAYLKLKDTEAGKKVDWEDAYRVLKDNAENWRDDQSTWGWPVSGAASTYRDLGYIVCDVNYYSSSEGRLGTSTWIMSCNKTLEYSYNDYCVAMVAKGLSEDESIDADKRAEYAKDYTNYLKRSENWKNLWNENAEGAGYYGFIWPKYANGEWFEGGTNPGGASFTDGTSWSGSWTNYFYEGSCYSYSFLVPHDIQTLIEKMGGEETFIKRLQDGINNGYIKIDNQPGFLQAFMFNETSEPWHTTDYVAKNLAKFTSTSVPGADDSGSLCAWYIFANIGIFPNAGQSYYYLTSPKYETTTLKVENGEFKITTENFSSENKYIQAVYLNGEPYYSTKLEHADIVKGGELKFVMGSTPVNYAAGPVASGTLASGQTWAVVRSSATKYTLNIGESTDNTSVYFNGAEAPWSDYLDLIDDVVIGSGAVKLGAGLLKGLTKCNKVTIPSTLTDLSESEIFAGCTSLTNIIVSGEESAMTMLDLSHVTAVSNDLFKDAAVGKKVALRLGTLTTFEPKKYFSDSTSVYLITTEGSAAYTWANNISSSDTRDNGYKFTLKNVYTRVPSGIQTMVSNGTTVDKYSWTLDVETGVLEFKRIYDGSWCELTFTASNTAFAEWVKDWKNDIKKIIMPSNFGKFTFESISVSPFDGLTNLEEVEINIDRWQINGLAPFTNCPKLTTIGTNKTLEVGKVKLGAYRLEGVKSYQCFNLFEGCTSLKYVDFTGFRMSSDDGSTATDLRIDANTFKGCTSLETVKLGGVKIIKSGAFNGCTALESLTIPTTLDTIESGAFTNCGTLNITLEGTTLKDGLIKSDSFPTDVAGVVILCENNTVRDAVRAILGTNNATIAVNKNAAASAGITMEGYSIRYSGYNGLRGIFKFDKSFVEENASEGFTLVEYGAIVASDANKETYGMTLTENNGEFSTANSAVVKKAVYRNGKFVNNYLSSTDDYVSFAVAIVKYASNYQSKVSMVGYTVWKDSRGNYTVKYAECENDDFKSTSIYDVTLGMYKDGFVNAEEDKDGVIWGVLSACAATLTEGTDYRAGDRDMNGTAFGSNYQFKNLPIYSVSRGSKVNSSSSGIKFTEWQNGSFTYTLLPDGDNYVAVIRGTGALPGKDSYDSYNIPEGMLSTRFNSRGAADTSLAYLYDDTTGEIVGYVGSNNSTKYVLGSDSDTLTTSAHRRQPSPTLTSACSKKINTVIFDHGVTNISDSMFYKNTGVKTVIYSDTVTYIGHRSFESATNLTTFSPVNKPTAENPSPSKPVKNLIDLSGITGGFARVSFNGAFRSTAVQIILPQGGNVTGSTASDNPYAMLSRGMFQDCTAITAISTSKETLTEGVADLRGITYIPEGTGSGSISSKKITKIYLDDALTTLGKNSFINTPKTFYTASENSVVSSFCGSTFTYKSGYTFEQMLAD